MARMLLMDEFHVSVYAPRGLTDPEYKAIKRVLNLARFRQRLRQAAITVAGRYSALKKIRIVVSL